MSDQFDNSVMTEAKRLKGLGFAVHWLHPKQKRPIGKDWAEKQPPTWDELVATHKKNNNLGVRLGKWSKMSDGLFLYCLDVDIRIPDITDEVLSELDELFPGIDIQSFPRVKSGSGGDSFHLYFVSDDKFRSRMLTHSEGKIKVTDPETGRDKWSREWEIELYGTGKQVVLPPSIHPKTGKPYKWVNNFDEDAYDLGITPFISAEHLREIDAPDDKVYQFEEIDPCSFTKSELTNVLDAISYNRINDYDDWVALGQALHHQFGGSAEGLELWIKYSRRSEKSKAMSERDFRTKWRSFGRYTSGALITMKSVIDWNQQDARKALLDDVEEVDEDDNEPDKEESAETTSSSSEDEDELLDEDDDEDYVVKPKPTKWTNLLSITEDGLVKSNLANVSLIIKNDVRLQGVIRRNTFTGETVIRKKPAKMIRKDSKKRSFPCFQFTTHIWDVHDAAGGELLVDAHGIAIRRMLELPKSQGGYGLKVTDRDLNGAVEFVSDEMPFHPIKEYFNTLKWDGVKRLDTFLIDHLGCEDNSYHRDVSRLCLVAAVTRVFEPGHKFDYTMILEGLQGEGKSTFIAVLAKHWFSELSGDFANSKEMVEKMQGSWIVEIPELSGFNRSDVRAIKAFISAQADKVRLAWAKRAASFKRQCIFIGSTNDKEYLKDPTGGRRFWPVACTIDRIDPDKLAAVVDQIWAEALVVYHQMREEKPIYKGMLPLYLSNPVSAAYAIAAQDTRRIESYDEALAGALEDWLDSPIIDALDDEDGFGDETPQYRQQVCIKEILDDPVTNDLTGSVQLKSAVISAAMATICAKGSWVKLPGRHRFGKGLGPQRYYQRVKPLVSQPETNTSDGWDDDDIDLW